MRAYSNYKATGLKWLRRIPDTWHLKRLRHVATLNPSRHEVANQPAGDLISFLPMGAIGEQGQLDLSDSRHPEEVFEGFTYFRNGDVVVAKITPCFENGKGALIRGLPGGFGFGTTELTVLRPRSQLQGKFLYYLTVSAPIRDMGEAEMYGAGGQKRVPDGFWRDLKFGLPPFPEQRQIAAFLDYETARIDRLIEKQQRLIGLLEEKRQAVIFDAVTKGIDADAPIKESGVDWLGEVPKHWEVTKVSHLGKLFGSEGNEPDDLSEEGETLFVQVQDLNGLSETLRLSNTRRKTNKNRSARDKQSPTVVFPKRGAAIFTNKVAWTSRAVTLDPNLMGFRPLSRVNARFFAYCLKARRLDDLADISTVPQINNKHIYPERFPAPPIEEQQQITAYLDTLLDKINRLAERTNACADLLSEHRTALGVCAVEAR